MAADYSLDALQRLALTLDVLRARGNNDKAHEEAGTPPVLDYDYSVVIDGRTLARPVNYQLLKILPTKGVRVLDQKRPYMIIDPRAGHGAGIGGFKPDSQVGVALRAGHPVYFVVFRQHPEPGQTLLDVMNAEAQFLREIARRHPESAKPVVVGNCQGGWATLILAAAHPELTGPLVLNGAPVATWSGQIGESAMRYNGGLLGGVLPALLMSDLGAGEFDGAHLVSNFEMLNPSRNFFGKYYDLFADVDNKRDSFLEFEKWWGGFHFTNEAEIRWIVEQLFVGNRLSKGEAQLEPGKKLDLKAIRAPIIVFASRGDNITPPQQALNWIVDTFVDEQEIRVRGQRILYMVHEKVGHLGIFVSSSVARKEHAEMASTLKTIEALTPGLYEMKIDETAGDEGNEHFFVSFHARTMQDILTTVENDREQEKDFTAVARLSEIGAQAYDLSLRPLVQSLVTQQSADALRDAHPSRVSRKLFSDANPLLALLQPTVDWARAERQPAQADNPFLALERLTAHSIMQGMDLVRDLRDAAYENTFLSIYGTPWMRMLGQSGATPAPEPDVNQLREMLEVKQALECMERGDLGAAVIRMLILLAGSRGSVRRDRLERSAQVLNHTQPFQSMGPQRRSELIQQQSLIAEFEPRRALETLPALLKTQQDRQQAMDVVNHILGARSEMEPHSLELIQRLESLLGVATPKPAPAGAAVSKAKPATTPATRSAKPAAKTSRARKEAQP
ncbi:alpha/beta hydrolase [Rhodoferax lacus]|uniref:Alpha/beta hydrolase n=2 Tax=Rhodoferax lacus TaxID=2184758 RepID=A0A3E1RDK0_9BURK|nr:alpha/beta hydrolase [Rhodoferax lacus]